MLLTNIDPDRATGGAGYRSLADRLNQTETTQHHELDGSAYAGSIVAPTVASDDSDKIPIPSISELAIDDGLIPVETERSMSPVSAVTPAVPHEEAPEQMPQEAVKVHVTKEIIRVDRSKLVKRIPKSSAGAASDALKRTLISAVEGQKHKIVETLLDRGVPPDTGPEKNAIMIAVLHRDTPSLKFLLEFGGNPDAPDAVGTKPLQQCTNREEQAKLLLEYGADANIAASGGTVLVYTLGVDQAGIRGLLLQYGADPNLIGQSGGTAMVYACSKGSPVVVQELIEWGGDPNQKNGNGWTPLEQACLSGHAKIIELLLLHGANPNTPGTQLPIKHCLGNAECLKLLLGAGADPHSCHGILELATWKGKVEVVQLLLDAGIDPNEQKDKVFRPLTTAIRDNRLDIFNLLLSRGADRNLKGEDFPLSMATRRADFLKLLIEAKADLEKCPQVMEIAVWRGNLESIQILLDAGVSPNQANPNGMTPLTTAVRDKHTEIVSFLLSHGADPNLIGQGYPLERALNQPAMMKILLAAGADFEKIPGILELAVWHKNLDVVSILLEHGMSPNQINPNGHIPLATAIRDNAREIFEFLLSHGADPNAKTTHVSPLDYAVHKSDYLLPLLKAGVDPRNSPGILEMAVWRNNIEAVRILLDEGKVDINEKRPSGHGPVTTAIRDKHVEILAELLSRGPDLSIQTSDGLPLVKAAQKDGGQMLEMLLDAGADIDAQQADGNTALMVAAWNGYMSSVKLLMKKGANAELVNKRGEGAMDIAANRGHEEIVIALLEGMS